MNGEAMEMSAEAVDPRWENERYLLEIILKQCGLTRNDLSNTALVKAKVRELKLDSVIN